MPRRAPVLAALTGAAVLLAGASGAPAARAPRPWATVNICDTEGHPDAIGIRGSIPGTGDRAQQMFMRFQVQFFDQAAARWRKLGARGDSGFVAVGSARPKTRQSGRTFTITPPPAGRPPYLLRGLVTFEWREDGAVVRRLRRRTAGGHPSTQGADPSGFSAATCEIR